MSRAFIELNQVARYYTAGDTQVRALDGISLAIDKGEFIAIMGQSGSGKSTLMNIIGCLDKPSAGEYRVNNHKVADLNTDELSALRLKTYGFVFQRYQLLPGQSALDNVAMPAVYGNLSQTQRRAKANELLTDLGLGDRLDHKPAELSGGQQQRVAIARALVNGAEVILADEPTGALDSESGEQVLALLKKLNAQGVTIILITHDAEVAAHAERTVRISDGKIVSDTGHNSSQPSHNNDTPLNVFPSITTKECASLALNSLRTNVFRTMLTLLGVIIGVAAVVVMMAIGEGGKQAVLDRIETIGTNLISVRPGGRNIRSSGDIASLTLADAQAIKNEIDGIIAVAPERSSRATLRFGNNDFSSRIRGTTPDYFIARDWKIARGVAFSDDDVNQLAPVIVIGQTVADALFTQGENPIGQYVLLKSALYQVIGITQTKGSGPGGDDMDDEVLLPITTANLRIFGRNYLSAISIKVTDAQESDRVSKRIEQLLTERHGKADVMVRTTASLVNAITETQNTLTWLLGSVAGISLLVGGIGVMNIMLVNVSERRREIGLRMATGAKPKDILRQFNIEALVVCLLGGAIGVLLGLLVSAGLKWGGLDVAYTLLPPILAFATCVLVGLIFGYGPARKAASLNPIAALADE